ncbi:hypothetical protein [Cellulomonas timonensis]|uniref:hypothetical protein n=1 Tax=Cellulomonas timonensis TaxID=1689271 RepID=UPI0008343E50|nr:hypothetical protein [Cellulomonas timonensis]
MESTPSPGIPQTPLTPQTPHASQAAASTPAPTDRSRTRRILIAVGGARWGGSEGGDSEDWQRHAPGQQRGGQDQDDGGSTDNSTEGSIDATSV